MTIDPLLVAIACFAPLSVAVPYFNVFCMVVGEMAKTHVTALEERQAQAQGAQDRAAGCL